jgi:hypothetical protein
MERPRVLPGAFLFCVGFEGVVGEAWRFCLTPDISRLEREQVGREILK